MKPSQNPIENQTLSARPASRNEGLIRSVRSSVVLAVSLATLEGCTMLGIGRSPQQNAMTAYDEGRYLDAKAFYAGVDPSKMTDEDRERLENIEWAINGEASHYLKLAKESTGRLEQRNDYSRAIRSLKATLLNLPADHPNRKDVEQQIADIRAKLALYEKEYGTQKKTLRDWLVSRKTDDEKLMTDLNIAFEQLRVRRIVLLKADGELGDEKAVRMDKEPYDIAVEYVKKFYKAGEYAKADGAVKIARAMDFKEVNYGEETQVTEGHERLFALIDLFNTHLTKEHQNKIKGLVADMQKALAESRYDEVRKKADEIRNLDAANASVTRILDEMETRLNPPKPKAVAARPRYVAPAPKGPSAEEIAALREEESKDAEALQAVDASLEQLRKDFTAGRWMEAFVGIDRAIQNFQGNKYVAKLTEQRDQWEHSRNKLIGETKDRANRLYKEEASATEILKAYQDLMKLNPPEADRKLAEERIKWFEGILSKSGSAVRK
ncbi:hypothetical protein HZA44_04255 [Candidatus Peregrinibacteria bacterium]|nr:hypothetical protein [Candidatus Peregrinibacteria bacterium]